LRILLLVDVQNLFYSVRDLFGIDARVDFKRLIEAAKNNREDVSVTAVAYLAVLGDSGGKAGMSRGIVAALKTVGYEVRLKEVRQDLDGKLHDTNLDGEIIVEAMSLLNQDSYDTLVLASGDGDFVPLYTKLHECGIRVEVLAFQDSLNREIVRYVNEVRLLGKSILFEPREGGVDARSIETGT